jgi:CheY-like chemotaxis protein
MSSDDKAKHDAAAGWSQVVGLPSRWEHPSFGVVVERDSGLWSFLPICGHDHYAAFSLRDAQEQAARRTGRCFACWSEAAKHGGPTGPLDTDHGFKSGSDEHRAAILVVDDDVDIRDALAEALDAYGYAVLRAANGAEALELLRSRDAPHVILLDLMMPVMDGFQFRAQQQMNTALATIPVVVITAGTTAPASELDDLPVLYKPISLSNLLQIVRQHCGR